MDIVAFPGTCAGFMAINFGSNSNTDWREWQATSGLSLSDALSLAQSKAMSVFLKENPWKRLDVHIAGMRENGKAFIIATLADFQLYDYEEKLLKRGFKRIMDGLNSTNRDVIMYGLQTHRPKVARPDVAYNLLSTETPDAKPARKRRPAKAAA